MGTCSAKPDEDDNEGCHDQQQIRRVPQNVKDTEESLNADMAKIETAMMLRKQEMQEARRRKREEYQAKHSKEKSQKQANAEAFAHKVTADQEALKKASELEYANKIAEKNALAAEGQFCVMLLHVLFYHLKYTEFVFAMQLH